MPCQGCARRREKIKRFLDKLKKRKQIVYTLENTVNIGKPIKVFDANGIELEGLTFCNVKTGEVLQSVIEDGSYKHWYGEIIREKKFYPAPLKIEKLY